MAPAKTGKLLSKQNRYNRECRLSRMLLLRKYPEELRHIVKQVQREGASPRVYGATVRDRRKKRKKERAPAFTLLRLEGDNGNGT